MSTLQLQYTSANSNPGYLEISRYLGQKLHLLFPLADVAELFTTWYSERWLSRTVFCFPGLAGVAGVFQWNHGITVEIDVLKNETEENLS